jgi:sulfur-oxidizing protein SoxZ
MARVLLRVPTTVEKGTVIELRALIQHVMETGYRPNAEGVLQPRDIIWTFTCRYDGEVVFNATLSPAIAANPFIAFTTKSDLFIYVFVLSAISLAGYCYKLSQLRRYPSSQQPYRRDWVRAA